MLDSLPDPPGEQIGMAGFRAHYTLAEGAYNLWQTSVDLRTNNEGGLATAFLCEVRDTRFTQAQN
jgi:hypothetical protein